MGRTLPGEKDEAAAIEKEEKFKPEDNRACLLVVGSDVEGISGHFNNKQGHGHDEAEVRNQLRVPEEVTLPPEETKRNGDHVEKESAS